MTKWQQRARLGVAVFGLACVVIVYFAIGHRQAPAPPAPVKRADPTAISETEGGTIARFREERRDFVVSSTRQFGYADGTQRLEGVRVQLQKSDGRHFELTAREGKTAGDNQQHLELTGAVTLKASDGFQMTAEQVTYNGDAGTIHSEAMVAFSKARMSGSGSGFDYNENTDVLSVTRQPHITTVDAMGQTVLEFTAGSAVLDRVQDLLTLDDMVHVIRGEQVMDANHSTAHLAANEEFITFIELRGDSRVAGGGGVLQAMTARDIDLDYTDDGQMLERVALNGGATVALAGTGGGSGRQLAGEAVDVQLGPDGMVTRTTGHDNVRMALPAVTGNPARTIQAKSFEASGPPGEGLTAAHFTDAVQYREEATGTVSGRVVHSRSLDLALKGDAVTTAVFKGEVAFDEQGFRAQSADAHYDPAAGTLHLTGGDGRGAPCVADDQISVDAQAIDVSVETRQLTAVGTVKTTLRPRGAAAAVTSACARALQAAPAAARAAGAGETHLPGLLQQNQVATVTADNLDYGGTGKPLLYTGKATLVQGDTSIRSMRIRIDQEHGDLVATGGARALLVQESGESRDTIDGRAEEIRYTDAKRLVAYLSAPANAPAGKQVQVTGPDGNLVAKNIDLFLAPEESRADRLEAYENVTAFIGTKKATGARLTYRASAGQYDMRGAGAVPVRIVDGCREMSGKTLTFFKSTDRIIVDGNEEMRTQTKSGGPCPPPRPSSR